MPSDHLINIVLVDDHHLVRDGLKALIADEINIQITGEASSGKELYEIIQNHIPDIVVLDISLPDISGIEITKKLSESHPEIKILILSMYTNEDFIMNSFKAGAKGYLPKNAKREELLEAIHTIYSGEDYYSEFISGIMLKSFIRKSKNPQVDSDKKDSKLTTRETEILKLSAEGDSNQDIADKLNISIRTVESHKNHIMQKLELRSTADMIIYAIKNKIIEI